MNQRPSRADVYSGSAEVSAEFLLRLVPTKPGEDGAHLLELALGDEAEEVELEIEVAPYGEIVSLHFHGGCYET